MPTSADRGDLPVDVDAIVELDLGIEVAPIAGLQDVDTEAFTTSDLTRICIDEWVYTHRVRRARFSLAHELGHVVLHKQIFERFRVTSISEWQEFYAAVDAGEYGWLEWQAYSFAGLLLVPRRHLEKEFRSALATVGPWVEEAKRQGFNRDDYLEYALGAVAERLRPVFDVADSAIRRRLSKDGLEALI